jgi:hypothetical protein
MPKQFLNVESMSSSSFDGYKKLFICPNDKNYSKITVMTKIGSARHFLVTITMVGNSSWNFNFVHCQMPQNTCWFDSISLKKSIKKAFHEYFIVKLIYTIFPFLLTVLYFPTYSFTVIFLLWCYILFVIVKLYN